MQVALYTMPNAIWTTLVLANVFFISIVYTNSLSSNVTNTTKNLWLAEIVLSAIIAALVQVQYSTSTIQPWLSKAVAGSLFVLGLLTFLRRSGLSSSQQKFAIATFAFNIAIAVKYLL